VPAVLAVAIRSFHEPFAQQIGEVVASKDDEGKDLPRRYGAHGEEIN
jgi:hypothetical protein